jgi:hypothetical protein
LLIEFVTKNLPTEHEQRPPINLNPNCHCLLFINNRYGK